jgi:opacity protein-like surface antigen
MKATSRYWRGWLLSLAALALLPVASAVAQDRAGTWETRLGILFQNSADWDFEGGTTADIDSDTSFLLGASFHLNENLELGGNVVFGQTDYDAEVATDPDGDGDPDTVLSVSGEYESTTLMFDATWNFLEGPFSPFVTAGLGWAWIDTNIADEPPQTGCWWDPWWGYVCTTFQDTKSIDGFAYGLGVGARYDFSDTLALSGSYRMGWVDLDNASGTPDMDSFLLQLGWKF